MLETLEVPPSLDWELLVIDNNSTDHTSEVVAEYIEKKSLPIRCFFEGRQGKAFALNTGIDNSTGEILAFVDDDCLVDKHWLTCVVTGFESNPEAIGLGGKVVALWDSEQPRWLNIEAMPGPIVRFDPGDKFPADGTIPIGANMAFRKRAFEKYGNFRTEMGPAGDAPGGAEDTEYGRRLLLRGEKLRYAPDAIVFHPVDPIRLTKKYFQRWYFYYGKALMKEHGYPVNAVTYWGIPRYLFRGLAVNFLKWLCAANPDKRFSRKLELFLIAGAFAACLGGHPKPSDSIEASPKKVRR